MRTKVEIARARARGSLAHRAFPVIACCLLLIGAPAGCYNPDYGNGQFQCRTGVCPPGYTCSASLRCVKEGAGPTDLSVEHVQTSVPACTALTESSIAKVADKLPAGNYSFAMFTDSAQAIPFADFLYVDGSNGSVSVAFPTTSSVPTSYTSTAISNTSATTLSATLDSSRTLVLAYLDNSALKFVYCNLSSSDCAKSGSWSHLNSLGFEGVVQGIDLASVGNRIFAAITPPGSGVDASVQTSNIAVISFEAAKLVGDLGAGDAGIACSDKVFSGTRDPRIVATAGGFAVSSFKPSDYTWFFVSGSTTLSNASCEAHGTTSGTSTIVGAGAAAVGIGAGPTVQLAMVEKGKALNTAMNHYNWSGTPGDAPIASGLTDVDVGSDSLDLYVDPKSEKGYVTYLKKPAIASLSLQISVTEKKTYKTYPATFASSSKYVPYATRVRYDGKYLHIGMTYTTDLSSRPSLHYAVCTF